MQRSNAIRASRKTVAFPASCARRPPCASGERSPPAATRTLRDNVLRSFTERLPGRREALDRVLRELEGWDARATRPLELEWFSELRSDPRLQGKLLSLAVELASPDAGAAARAAAQLDAMGLLALPVLEVLARSSADELLARRAAGFLVRHGIYDAIDIAIEDPSVVSDLAAAIGGELWRVAEHRGGPTLLTLQSGLVGARRGPAFVELPRFFDPNWTHEDKEALSLLVERAADARRPAAEREELIRFLCAYLEHAVPREPGHIPARRAVRAYGAPLREAITDQALSVGHRYLALALFTGELPRELWSGRRGSTRPRRSAKRVPRAVIGGRGPGRRPASPAIRPGQDPGRETEDDVGPEALPEATSLIKPLARDDPIIEAYGLSVAELMDRVLPEDRRLDLRRTLTWSAHPLLRA